MKRSMKKGIAFFMALSLMVGLYQPMNVSAAQGSNDSLTKLTEEVYDEAVVLTDKVVLLENGNFAGSTNEDFEYVAEDQYSNVSIATNIVFMDAKGNKTVISNKGSNGDTLFDAVYPMISEGWYLYDMVKVIKDNKISYIKDDGTYFGSSLKYYHFAEPISNDLLVVSEDGTNYSVINSKGETMQKNLQDYTWTNSLGQYYSIFYGNNCLVIDAQGKTVKKFEYYDAIYTLGNGYIWAKTKDTSQLFDSNFNLVLDLDPSVHWVYTDSMDVGYLSLYVRNDNEDGSYSDEYQIIDFATQKCLYTFSGYPSIVDGLIIGEKTAGQTVVQSLDGKEYISNLNEVVASMIDETYGYSWINYSYVDERLYVSFYGYGTEPIKKSIVFSKADGFSKDKALKLEGAISISYDSNYLITEDGHGNIIALYKADGTLIKTFKNNETYRWVSRLLGSMCRGDQWEVKQYDGIAFGVDVVDDGIWNVATYVTTTGAIGKTYTQLYGSGNYLIGKYEDGKKIDIINSSGKVIKTVTDAEAGGYWGKDYYYVTQNGRCLIYDEAGNVLMGNEKSYASIGDNGFVKNMYFANADDNNSGYSYQNMILENGLCVTSIKQGDVYKYGVGIIASYTGLKKVGNEWQMYENGVVTGKYNGLVKYNNLWWYVKNSKVDFGYTGLCKYSGSWFYVKEGKVDFSYTGLCKYNGSWYYVKGGKVDFSYTGLCKYGSNWYYMNKGILKWDYTGLCKYNGSWFYVKEGKVDFGYTGLCKYNGTWYYVQKGILKWNYTGLCKYGSSWYYVKNGVLDWNYNGLCKYGSSWYYVKGGKVDFGYTGLCKYSGSWYYVKKGILDWNYTGLCKYGSSWYYVQKGVLNWKYTGYTNYGGSRWYVKNGVMVKKA